MMLCFSLLSFLIAVMSSVKYDIIHESIADLKWVTHSDPAAE